MTQSAAATNFSFGASSDGFVQQSVMSRPELGGVTIVGGRWITTPACCKKTHVSARRSRCSTRRTRRHDPARRWPAVRRSISRITCAGSKRAAWSPASITPSTKTASCIRWCAGSSRAGSPRTSAALSSSPMSSTAPGGATIFRSRSARSPPRRKSTRSAWASRSKISAKPGRTRSRIRSRRSSSPRPPVRKSSSRATTCSNPAKVSPACRCRSRRPASTPRPISRRLCASRAIRRPACRTWAPIAPP